MWRFLILAAGCSAGIEDSALPASEVELCLETYAVAAGYDHGGEDLAAIESECLAEGGSDCAAEDYISEDAALCLAEVYGLEEGIEPWSADLVFHHGDMVPRWNVDAVLASTGASQEGRGVAIAAATGDLVESYSWDAQP